MTKEYVVCACNKYITKDGEFEVAGVRHHACYYDPRVIALRESKEKFDVVEGFLTTKIVEGSRPPKYRFVDRVEAKELAIASGQHLNNHPYFATTKDLFSECLYPIEEEDTRSKDKIKIFVMDMREKARNVYYETGDRSILEENTPYKELWARGEYSIMSRFYSVFNYEMNIDDIKEQLNKVEIDKKDIEFSLSTENNKSYLFWYTGQMIGIQFVIDKSTNLIEDIVNE